MHKLDESNGILAKIVDAVDDTTSRLPFVHSTDAHGLRSMTMQNAIIPQPCNVFEPERLTYLFYGRPSYRPNEHVGATTHTALLPVCLIFKADAAIKIKRVFPFDSGAFQNDFLDSFLHPKMSLGDFLLTADPATPGKLISYVFGTNENYVKRKLQRTDPEHADDFEVQSYLDIASAKGTNKFDIRSATIEVQTEESLNFSDTVEAVILPSSLEGSPTHQALVKNGAQVIFYQSIDMLSPNTYTSEISTICRSYFIQSKLLEEAGS